MKRYLLALIFPALVLCSFTCNKNDQDDKVKLSGCDATFIRKQASNISAKLYYVSPKGWMLDIVFTADNEGYRCQVCNQSDAQLQAITAGLATDGTRYDVTISGKIKDYSDNEGVQPPGAPYPNLYWITLEAIVK